MLWLSSLEHRVRSRQLSNSPVRLGCGNQPCRSGRSRGTPVLGDEPPRDRVQQACYCETVFAHCAMVRGHERVCSLHTLASCH